MTDRQHMFGGLTEILGNVALISGPSNWDEVEAKDFGTEHDFDIEDHGSIIIMDCYSNAALQWCYRHLPEDCPRWGAQGFAIETNFAGAVIEGARRDGLMSRGDYEKAMHERDELATQWEDQNDG